VLLGALALAAAIAGAGWAGIILGLPSLAFAMRVIHDCGEATAAVLVGLDQLQARAAGAVAP
jgi:hypothetical protein